MEQAQYNEVTQDLAGKTLSKNINCNLSFSSDLFLLTGDLREKKSLNNCHKTFPYLLSQFVTHIDIYFVDNLFVSNEVSCLKFMNVYFNLINFQSRYTTTSTFIKRIP